MENKNPSSFTNALFGAADSSPNPPSNGLFSPIFAHPSAAAARNYSTSKFNEDEHKLPHGSRSLDNGVRDDVIKDREGVINFSSSKETNSFFQERAEPSPLSSSLYYGGKEDMYVQSSSPRTAGPHTDMPMEIIQLVLREGTGGKVHFIIEALPRKSKAWESSSIIRNPEALEHLVVDLWL